MSFCKIFIEKRYFFKVIIREGYNLAMQELKCYNSTKTENDNFEHKIISFTISCCAQSIPRIKIPLNMWFLLPWKKIFKNFFLEKIVKIPVFFEPPCNVFHGLLKNSVAKMAQLVSGQQKLFETERSRFQTRLRT